MVGLATCGAAVAAQAPVAAPCRALCAPALTLFPALNRSPVAGAPRVQRLCDGSVHRIPSASNVQLTLVATARTAVPRVGIVGSVQWLPNATASGNPFTRYTASELATTHLRANAPTATFAVTGALLRTGETHGWLDLRAHVVAATGIVDHVATGLPRAVDEVPRGERRDLTAARPLTLLAGLSLPLAMSTP